MRVYQQIKLKSAILNFRWIFISSVVTWSGFVVGIKFKKITTGFNELALES